MSAKRTWHWSVVRFAPVALALAVLCGSGTPARAGEGQQVCVSFDPGPDAIQQLFTPAELDTLRRDVVNDVVALCGERLKPWEFTAEQADDAPRLEFLLERLPTDAMVLRLRLVNSAGDTICDPGSEPILGPGATFPDSALVAAQIKAKHAPELLKRCCKALGPVLADEVRVGAGVFLADIKQAVADVVLDVARFKSLNNKELRVTGLCGQVLREYKVELIDLGRLKVGDVERDVWKVRYRQCRVGSDWQAMDDLHVKCVEKLGETAVYLLEAPKPLPAGRPGRGPAVAPPPPPPPQE
jgi:hypothetical protein